MIKFDIKILRKNIQNLYEERKMLKNTELLIDGIKFVSGLTYPKLMKWEKAIVIYQVLGKKTNECHFGLLVKYGSRILSYDGMEGFWPIMFAEKSYHWEKQPNSWSCGYIALFWAMTILSYGLDRWIAHQEP